MMVITEKENISLILGGNNCVIFHFWCNSRCPLAVKYSSYH